MTRTKQIGRIRSLNPRALWFGSVFGTACLAAAASLACAFDMVKPERTAIDWIVDAETLVLARPQEANPYLFGVTHVLAGDVQAPPIDQLVDRESRAKLSISPMDAVLFAYQPSEGWRRIALVNDGFRSVLQTALDNRTSWRAAMPQSRLNFIVALQASSTPTHKAIVIAELDKVPYEDLRALELKIPTDELLADLWTPAGYQYQAIRALLLGLSGTPAAREEINDYITRVVDWDWANNLGAFAAAFIELEGAKGIEFLAANILHDPTQPLDKLEQIVMAMSVHHDLADVEHSAAIQKAIATLVRDRPKAAAIVARQFSLRSDWSQSAILEPLVRERAVGITDLLTISVYLARAREDAALATASASE